MADQVPSETQFPSVGQSGGASASSKPTVQPPRRTKHTGHYAAEIQTSVAGEGWARGCAKPSLNPPAPENDADRATVALKPSEFAPDPHESPQGAHGANPASKPTAVMRHAKEGGQNNGDAQCGSAPLANEPGHSSIDVQPPCARVIGSLIDEAGQRTADAQMSDARFADPLIVQIREQWRLRQDMVRAMSKLTLQAKAMLRRLCGGDKDEADKLYRSLSNGKDHSLAATAAVVVAPLLIAREPLEETRKALEKRLEKLAKGLPIAHMVEDIKGFGYGGLAGIVGECGDLSEYKSVAAVWKFCGLAVINGERQRKKTGDAAIEQGYNPQLRSLIWTLADSLFKNQSRGVNDGAEVGPYRVAYDRYKALELEKTAEYRDKETGKTEVEPLTPKHAHNRAMRKMSKDLLRDLVVAWRADRAKLPVQTIYAAPDPQSLIAAE